jgi:hypothetical protein
VARTKTSRRPGIIREPKFVHGRGERQGPAKQSCGTTAANQNRSSTPGRAAVESVPPAGHSLPVSSVLTRACSRHKEQHCFQGRFAGRCGAVWVLDVHSYGCESYGDSWVPKLGWDEGPIGPRAVEKSRSEGGNHSCLPRSSGLVNAARSPARHGSQGLYQCGTRWPGKRDGSRNGNPT